MAGLELKAASTAEVASLPLPSAKGHGDKKHSIDMGAQHSLEWNVTSFQVGSGKSKKSILNLVGTCVFLCERGRVDLGSFPLSPFLCVGVP